MKLFVPTFGLPYSHPLRASWRKFGLDPLVDNVLRVASLVCVTLAVFVLLWIGFVTIRADPDWVETLFYGVFIAALFIMVALAAWYMSMGPPSFEWSIRDLQEELKTPLEKSSHHDLRWLAVASLTRLAYFVKKAERSEPNPYHELREEAKADFKKKYHLFLMFGLIEDVGYGHFFNAKLDPPHE